MYLLLKMVIFHHHVSFREGYYPRKLPGKSIPAFQAKVLTTYEPGSKLLVLGMVIQPLIGNPFNGYINPYYWVDDDPLLYGNNGSLDPSTYHQLLHWTIQVFSFFWSSIHVGIASCEKNPGFGQLKIRPGTLWTVWWTWDGNSDPIMFITFLLFDMLCMECIMFFSNCIFWKFHLLSKSTFKLAPATPTRLQR